MFLESGARSISSSIGDALDRGLTLVRVSSPPRHAHFANGQLSEGQLVQDRQYLTQSLNLDAKIRQRGVSADVYRKPIESCLLDAFRE